MNNNRNNNNNNRRRGRGNRPQGGGQQLNRIDSRARGNAPQLLEKYRKLAQDAHLNGDRVQAEYYLQFADHYFRVLADQRVRQEEQRLRRDDRWEGGPEEGADEAGEFIVDSDFPAFDQAPYHRREREERPREERQREDRPREDRQREDRPREDRQREDRPQADSPRQARALADDAAADTASDEDNADRQDAPRNRFEPTENPFVRDQGSRDQGSRDQAPREPGTGRGLKPRRNQARRGPAAPAGDDDLGAAGIDPSILPPPIALSAPDLAADDLPPVKRPRGRPRKAPAAETGDTLATAGQD